MAKKVVETKSFIGGRLVYPGEEIDVDEQGGILPAGSTPLDQLTDEELEAVLASRRGQSKLAQAMTAGSNLADPTRTNTGAQDAGMAPFRPAAPGATIPQGVPPGSEEHGGGFIRPASADAPAAIEQLVPDRHPLDGDGDGQPGGSVPADPPSLAGKNKAQLTEIATSEGVTVHEGMTNAQIVQAIEAKRAGE